MNRLADVDIDPSLVDPMRPDYHHQQTSNALRSRDIIGMIRRTISAAITFVPSSIMQVFLCQSVIAKTARGQAAETRRR
jgi:hypothetical protein